MIPAKLAPNTSSVAPITVTKALFDNLDELAQVHPEAANITVETAVNTPIGLHQGAQLYFDEQAQ